jgi:hypothetical protein
MSLVLFLPKPYLETVVGSQKSAQALGAPDKIQKCLITTEVTTTFCISPCTPTSYTSFLRPTAVSRFTDKNLSIILVVSFKIFL